MEHTHGRNYRLPPPPLILCISKTNVHCMEFICHSHAIKNSTQQQALIYQLLKASNFLSFAIGKNYILQVFNFANWRLQVFNFATLVKIRNESFIEYQFFYFWSMQLLSNFITISRDMRHKGYQCHTFIKYLEKKNLNLISRYLIRFYGFETFRGYKISRKWSESSTIVLFELLPSLQHSSTSLSQCCELFRIEQDSPTYWLSLTHKMKILLHFVWFSRRKLIVTHIMTKILLFCSINGFMRAKSIFCSRTSRSSNNFDQ